MISKYYLQRNRRFVTLTAKKICALIAGSRVTNEQLSAAVLIARFLLLPHSVLDGDLPNAPDGDLANARENEKKTVRRV